MSFINTIANDIQGFISNFLGFTDPKFWLEIALIAGGSYIIAEEVGSRQSEVIVREKNKK